MSNVIIYDTYNVNVTIQNDEVVGVQVVAGFIHDVIAGTNISIDKSDPLNPVISSTGGGAGTWGSITGTLSNQTDLQNALDAKLSSLSNGNGTTANGSAVDLGGTQNANIVINNGSTHSWSIQYPSSFRVDDASGNTLNLAGGSGITLSSSAGLSLISSGVPFTLTLGSDATGDTYYRNSSGYFTRLAAGTNGHVLTLAGGIPSWAAPTSGWALTGTSTLTGAVDIVGTSSNTIKHTFASLGTTQTNGAGLWFTNTTAAAAGAQQISPSIVLEGQGWKTNATAASQSVKFAEYVLPVQGAANPTAELGWYSSINGGAYTRRMYINDAGTFVVGSSGSSWDANGSLTLGTNRILVFNGGLGTIGMDANAGLAFRANASSTVPTGGYYRFFNNNGSYSATSGTLNIMANETSFAPTSGTAVFNAFLGSGTINQTGGANGDISMIKLTPTYTAAGNDVHGFYYNPTVTSVTGVHYSFRATSGLMALPASTTTRSSFRIPHGSAPSSPVDGDIWTTTAGIYVRINGATVGPLS